MIPTKQMAMTIMMQIIIVMGIRIKIVVQVIRIGLSSEMDGSTSNRNQGVRWICEVCAIRRSRDTRVIRWVRGEARWHRLCFRWDDWDKRNWDKHNQPLHQAVHQKVRPDNTSAGVFPNLVRITFEFNIVWHGIIIMISDFVFHFYVNLEIRSTKFGMALTLENFRDIFLKKKNSAKFFR
jgi:hypothetical protein